MVDLSFSIYDLEYFLLIFVRVSCFVYIAPYFGMNDTPARIRIGISFFTAWLLYGYVTGSGYERDHQHYRCLVSVFFYADADRFRNVQVSLRSIGRQLYTDPGERGGVSRGQSVTIHDRIYE